MKGSYVMEKAGEERGRRQLTSMAECLAYLVSDEGEITALLASDEMGFSKEEHAFFGRLHHLFVFQPPEKRLLMMLELSTLLERYSDHCC